MKRLFFSVQIGQAVGPQTVALFDAPTHLLPFLLSFTFLTNIDALFICCQCLIIGTFLAGKILFPCFAAAREKTLIGTPAEAIGARKRLCGGFFITLFGFLWPWIGFCLNFEPFTWLVNQFTAFHNQATFSGSYLDDLYRNLPVPPRLLFFFYWIGILVMLQF